ncbi:MAG: hypothetical protein L7F77_15065, partial [Candidatus Magnetominusculus sp. LBB02]|nr:hypothetical protein [Candidatus Magnetominusculus sp. LBB02]
MKDETIKDIIFAIAMVLCLILMAIQYVDSSPRRRFRDRAELSPDEFYQQYYESSGLPKDLVIETLNLISTEISIPATLLRPTDIFAELDISALDCAELAIKLDDLIKEKGSNYKTDDLLTIDACIRCVVDLRQMESKPDNTAKCNPKYD